MSDRFAVQRSWMLLMADLGVQAAEVLRLADLPADLFTRGETSLSTAQYFNLWRGLELATGGESLPLRLGQAMSVEAFDAPIFAALCSADLNQALQRLGTYKRLIGPLQLHLEIGAECSVVELRCDTQHALPRLLALAEAVFLTQLARIATRTRICPVALELPELPRDVAAHEAFFACPLRATGVTRISFSAPDARRPFLTENAGLWGFFEGQLNQRLSKLHGAAPWRDRVSACLLEMLPAGQSSAADVARRLGLSTRSLQRHLNEEGTRFVDILSAVRQQLAEHYLARSELAPGEISFLLGFRDSNSFHRAFKDWTGATPGRVRGRLAAA